MFDNFWVANIVGGPPRRNRHHVQLRVGAVGDVNGGGAGQLCLPRAVGGQQDRGREDAHLLASFSSAVRCISPHRATTYTAWSGAIRPLWDGRFTAHSGAEGGIHRPCAYCIKYAKPFKRSAMHPSAWKGNSPKFVCRFVHRSPPRGVRMASKTLHTSWRSSTSCG